MSTSLPSCSVHECSVRDSGKCVLAHEPAKTCPNFAVDTPTNAIPYEEPEGEYFYLAPGNELGTTEAARIMARRYTRIVAVLGDNETGKTSLLGALYLLAARNELPPGLSFAGSATLLGFEQRLVRVREWTTGPLPERLVDHTAVAEPRAPAFVHLTLAEKNRPPHELLFADIPGEWTKSLRLKGGKDDRYAFLRRADSILIALRAGDLARPEHKHRHIQDARVLLERLQTDVRATQSTPIIFTITHMDRHGPDLPSAAMMLSSIAAEFGFVNSGTIGVASWSDNPQIPSGTGVGTTLAWILRPAPVAADPRAPPPAPERFFWADHL